MAAIILIFSACLSAWRARGKCKKRMGPRGVFCGTDSDIDSGSVG